MFAEETFDDRFEAVAVADGGDGVGEGEEVLSVRFGSLGAWLEVGYNDVSSWHGKANLNVVKVRGTVFLRCTNRTNTIPIDRLLGYSQLQIFLHVNFSHIWLIVEIFGHIWLEI